MFTVTHNDKQVAQFSTGGAAHKFCTQRCFEVSGYNEFVIFNNGIKFSSFNADDLKLRGDYK